MVKEQHKNISSTKTEMNWQIQPNSHKLCGDIYLSPIKSSWYFTQTLLFRSFWPDSCIGRSRWHLSAHIRNTLSLLIILCRYDHTDKGEALHWEGMGRVKDVRAQGFQGSRISEIDDISMSGRVEDVEEIDSPKRKNFNKETK